MHSRAGLVGLHLVGAFRLGVGYKHMVHLTAFHVGQLLRTWRVARCSFPVQGIQLSGRINPGEVNLVSVEQQARERHQGNGIGFCFGFSRMQRASW